MISFLVAMDANRLIGKDNDLPWYLPADLKYFKKVTMGHPIIMGRRTYESIGKALPGRRNIILTHDMAFKAADCEIVHSKDEALQILRTDDENFVIGGAAVFKSFFDSVDRLYITLIHETFDGDTYFPPIDEENWILKSSQKGATDNKNLYSHDFLIYDRK